MSGGLGKDLKLLLIGVGRWGRNHLKALTRLVDELYVVDADPSQLKACGEFSIPGDHLSTNYHDFLDRIDGVDIVTPADSHLAICMDCFRKGKDVFVEKPIALTSQEAKEMVLRAEESRRILQVGHIYRYHPASSKIKQIIEEGRLGTLEYAYGHFMGFKRPRMDVGVTQTDAIHYFDLFNYLFDRPPQAVTAVTKNYLGLRLDDTSMSVLDFQGRMVFIEAGYLPPEKRRDIAIIGDRASLYCDFQKNSLLFCDSHHERKGERCVAVEGEAQGISIGDNEPLRAELEAFLDSMRHRSEPLANGRAGYEALRIVEACYESSQRGKRIEIDWTES